MAPRFDFYPNGFENTPHPCLVVDDPNGGDPHILGLFSVLYRPRDIEGLVQMANSYLATTESPAKTETHIDRECALLGHEFAYEPDEDQADGPMHCIHCGTAAR